MAQATTQPGSKVKVRTGAKLAAVAWVAATFYFYQHVMRSAPSSRWT